MSGADARAAAEAQAAWVAWIWGAAGSAPPAGLRPVGAQGLERGLAAYREHAKALAVRALAARYPLLRAELGETDFAGLAWAYARQHPPRQGDLNAWGEAMPEFLQALPDMDPAPPLLARVDDALHRLGAARDDAPQDPHLWQTLQQQDAARLRLRWSAHLRLIAVPVELADRLDAGNEPLDAPEGWLLVWRRGWRPCRAWLAADQADWLQRQAHAPSLASALTDQLACHPHFDLGAALARAWQQGWLLGADLPA